MIVSLDPDAQKEFDYSNKELEGIDMIWASKSNFCQSIRVLVNQVAATDTCLIHDHGQWAYTNRQSACLARRLSIPRIVTPHGMLSPWALNHKRWKKRLAWNVFGRKDLLHAHVVHATSELEEAELRQLGVRNPIALIANGVDVLRPPPVDTRPGQRPYCLFMSRIHEKKGIMELLKIWSKLGLPNWDLILAGPDEQNLMRDTNLPENVRYVGSVYADEKSKLLHQASIFVLPTYSENFGVVIAEALMAGVPVITTQGAPWDGLLKYQCGWWTAINMEAIELAILEATNTPSDELVRMGQRGTAWMKEQYNWQTIGKQMAEVYGWMTNSNISTPQCIRFH